MQVVVESEILSLYTASLSGLSITFSTPPSKTGFSLDDIHTILAHLMCINLVVGLHLYKTIKTFT